MSEETEAETERDEEREREREEGSRNCGFQQFTEMKIWGIHLALLFQNATDNQSYTLSKGSTF